MSFITLRAFAVHVFTACGAVLGLLALILATGGHWTMMFACLGLALLVDGVDGPMARRFKVGEALPRWNGEALDLVVDFVTYVFVPAYAIAASGYLPFAFAVPLSAVIVVTGAIYFADRSMKTEDSYFCGFPAVWNLAAFYLYVMTPPPWLAAGSVLALAILTFVPVRFLHPLRVKRGRPLNIALLILWALLALFALMTNLEPGDYVRAALLAIGLYFMLAGLLRRPA